MTSRPLPAPAHVKDAIGSCPKVPGEGAGGPTAPLLRRSFPDSANTNPACPVRRELQRHDGELFGDGRVPGSTGARFAAFALGFVLLSFHRSSLLRFPYFLQVRGTNREARNRARLPAPPRALCGSPRRAAPLRVQGPCVAPTFLPQDPLSPLLGPKCFVALVFGS